MEAEGTAGHIVKKADFPRRASPRTRCTASDGEPRSGLLG